MTNETNPNLDLLMAFPKGIEEMSDSELREAITLVRELRKLKVAKKKKSTLDAILEELNPEISMQILRANQDQNAKEKTQM